MHRGGVSIKKLLLLLLIVLFPQQAFAEGADFGVTALLPENQISDATYFDLSASPGTSQTLAIQLNNSSNQTKKLILTPVDAETADQGQIIYQKKHTNGVSSWLSKSQTIVLQANQTKTVSIELSIPKHITDGVYLGAFQISESASGEDSPGIDNQFAYILGIKVTIGTPPLPDWQLKKIRQIDDQLLLTLENTSQALVSHQRCVVTLREIGAKKDTLVFDQTISAAPQSTFQLSITNNDIASGNYHFTMKIYGEKTVTIKKNYRINKDKAGFQFRELDLDQQHRLGWLVLSSMCLLSIIGVIYKKRRRNR